MRQSFELEQAGGSGAQCRGPPLKPDTAESAGQPGSVTRTEQPMKGRRRFTRLRLDERPGVGDVHGIRNQTLSMKPFHLIPVEYFVDPALLHGDGIHGFRVVRHFA